MLHMIHGFDALQSVLFDANDRQLLYFQKGKVINSGESSETQSNRNILMFSKEVHDLKNE